MRSEKRRRHIFMMPISSRMDSPVHLRSSWKSTPVPLSGNVFSAFCFLCTKHFHTLPLPCTWEAMKLSHNSWFMTLKRQRNANLHATVYAELIWMCKRTKQTQWWRKDETKAKTENPPAMRLCSGEWCFWHVGCVCFVWQDLQLHADHEMSFQAKQIRESTAL